MNAIAPKSALHKAALEQANSGRRIFPCIPRRKEPLYAGGHHSATNDLAKIDAWWTAQPNANIGWDPAPSGECIVDLDGTEGEAALAEHEALYGQVPPTRENNTPRGGRHIILKGDLPTTAGKLGRKIDTRGSGDGYVLLPPSVIAPGEYKNNPHGGAYTVKEDREVAAVPFWMVELLAQSPEPKRIVAIHIEPDLPCNIARASSFLETRPPAVEGEGGDAHTVATAAVLHDLGLSEEGALEQLIPWNERCKPAWEPEELAVKVANAYRYAQNHFGCDAVRPAVESFADYLTTFPEVPTNEKRSRFYPLDQADQDALAEPIWIIPNLIQANSLVVAFGKPKSFKSFLVLDLVLGIAAGETTFGHKPEPRPVVYCAGEGANMIARKHRPAWLKARKRIPDFPFYIIPCVPKAAKETDVKELIEQIEARGIRPGVVVIDTMARSVTGLEENSSRDVGLFIEKCDLIRETLSCAVIVVHHSGKVAARGSRGSNALDGALDTMLEVVRHEKSGIREAMEGSGAIALGRVAMYSRERLMAIEPRDNGLLAYSLRMRDEVVSMGKALESVPHARAQKPMVEIAERIIAQLRGPFNPNEFRDRYEESLRELIRRKQKGEKIVASEPAAEPSNVIDLMAALKKSLSTKGEAPKRGRHKIAATKSKTHRKRA